MLSTRKFFLPTISLSYFAISAITLAHTSCLASQRVEDVEIREIDGVPCFSIPLNSETRKGIPFYSITVSEAQATSPESRPERYWQTDIAPNGKSIPITPKDCFRYGSELPSGEQLVLKPLEPFKVYSVSMFAHPHNSNLVGYTGQFCLTKSSSGRLSVKVLRWDKRPDAERFSACAP